MNKNKIIKPLLMVSVILLQMHSNILFAQDQKDKIIKIGMHWKNAEKILKEFKAKEIILQMAPPESPNGGYMELHNYAIGDKTIITIIYDKVEGENVIIDLSLEENRDKPKIYHRSISIEEIDLLNNKFITRHSSGLLPAPLRSAGNSR